MSDRVPDDVPDEVAGGDRRSPTQVTPALLRAWPLPSPDGSKYRRGQAVVVGGDRNTPGAVLLAGQAALRVGAGRLTLATARSIAPHVATQLPEGGTVPLDEDDDGQITGEGAASRLEDSLGRADAVLLGPGLGTPEGATRVLEATLEARAEGTPLVLDAFGATVLPQMSARHLDRVRGSLVLTPNRGELAFLTDRSADEVQELADEDVAAVCEDVARRYDAVVGCESWVVAPGGGVWATTTGDTGLGTSGSGDVMAGAVLGLLARGADPCQALVWGKHVHAAAGDSLAGVHGRVGYLAREVPAHLPVVLRTLGGD